MTWLPSTLDDLAAIWDAASDREAVTRAVARVDRLLESSPSTQGESRPRRARILFEKPVSVTYEVDEDSRSVYVIGVRDY